MLFQEPFGQKKCVLCPKIGKLKKAGEYLTLQTHRNPEICEIEQDSGSQKGMILTMRDSMWPIKTQL